MSDFWGTFFGFIAFTVSYLVLSGVCGVLGGLLLFWLIGGSVAPVIGAVIGALIGVALFVAGLETWS